MWVADMDFQCAQAIVEAVTSMAEHGIYGYSRDTGSYNDAVCHWFQSRHAWRVDPQTISRTQGIVQALNMCVQAFVQPGQKVLLNGPVYYPFYSAITLQGANVVSSSLQLSAGRYGFDFNDLEAKLSDPDVKMAFLCNPHNPGGTAWSAAELRQYAGLCLQHNVLLVSDEIHGDLVLSGNHFTPLLTLDSEFSEHTIVLTSPSKAFNIAGLHCSNVIVPNPALKKKFDLQSRRNAVPGLSPFALVATEAAYNSGAPWLDDCLDYLQVNLEYALDFFDQHIPSIQPMRPQATYLLWLDCSKLEMDSKQLHQLFNTVAKVYLDDGVVFGAEGSHFVRLNFACSKRTLTVALDRIKAAVDGV